MRWRRGPNSTGSAPRHPRREQQSHEVKLNPSRMGGEPADVYRRDLAPSEGELERDDPWQRPVGWTRPDRRGGRIPRLVAAGIPEPAIQVRTLANCAKPGRPRCLGRLRQFNGLLRPRTSCRRIRIRLHMASSGDHDRMPERLNASGVIRRGLSERGFGGGGARAAGGCLFEAGALGRQGPRARRAG